MMETYVIIGYRPYRFRGHEGDEVTGISLFCTYTNSNVTGEACEKLNIGSKVLNGFHPEIGDRITVSYNRYGKVSGIQYAD